MRILHQLLAVLLLIGSGFPLLAASSIEAPHVHVELLIPRDKLFVDRPLNDAGIYFKMERGWHIYWKNAGDAGLPPDISWKLPAGITATGIEFPAPRRLSLGPLVDYGYEDEALFPLKVRVDKSVPAGPATLHAKVSWLICQNTCIPGSGELEIVKNVDTRLHPSQPLSDPLFKRFLSRIPRPLPAEIHPVFQATKEGFRLTVETGQQEKSAVFFPLDPDIIDNPAPQKFTSTANGLTLDLKKDAALSTSLARLHGVLELSGGRAFELTALPASVVPAALPAASPVPVSSTGLPASTPAPAPKSAGPGKALPFSWATLLRASGLAFLGGVLLNLMPCVFPVLFIKGLALVNSGHQEQHKMRTQGLVYSAGILFSFWGLVAVLLGLRAAGATLGWGFQFQSPVFLELMAGLLFFLGLSLAGQFEIGLTLTSAGGSLANKQGYAGSFFTGVLAVVVATPCTAPLMGTAIGYALTQSAIVTFAVFTALALGLAAPYFALTLQPSWTRLLPRPGAWMEVLRQACSVPIFATVIWLAWVLAQAYGANVLTALLTSFLLLAMAGWFLGRWPARKGAILLAALLLGAVVALAVFSQRWAEVRAGATSTDRSANSYPAAQTDWQPWSEEAVRRSLAQGRPVFVDFTASWCLSCQVNEKAALKQPQVQQAFHSKNVVLLRADWTRHDEAITRALTALGRSGVPAYALYIPGQSEPRLLPELLTPSIVINALNKLPNAVSTAKH
jgi:thiol:disulfide interchange protein/DsbC/DsbD-like thiol-disulfide interchange protein